MLHCDVDAQPAVRFQGKNVRFPQPIVEMPPETCNHATLVVPAHNEAAGIADNLLALVRAIECLKLSQPHLCLALVVACNGCSDDTASRARGAVPTARVLDLPTRGKAGAINAALTESPPGPVIVIDADVVPDARTLSKLLSILACGGVLAASPKPNFVIDAASAPVRAYYRVFTRHPYVAQGVGGAGVYGLSAKARTALGQLPAVAADDQYIRHRFPLAAQRRIDSDDDGYPITVAVRPPTTLAALLSTEIRSRNGDRMVRSLLPAVPAAHAEPRWFWTAWRDAPLDFLVFAAIKLLARLVMPFSRSGLADGWSPLRE